MLISTFTSEALLIDTSNPILQLTGTECTQVGIAKRPAWRVWGETIPGQRLTCLKVSSLRTLLAFAARLF